MVANHTIFNCFVKSCAQFTLRQREQGFGIDDDSARLMERPDQIFSERMVDRCLASHRTIDLRKQRCGNLYVVRPTKKGRSDKSCEIAHHSSSDCEDGIAPFEPVTDQKSPGALGRANGFCPLTVANEMRKSRESGLLQALFHRTA